MTIPDLQESGIVFRFLNKECLGSMIFTSNYHRLKSYRTFALKQDLAHSQLQKFKLVTEHSRRQLFYSKSKHSKE